MQLSALVHFLNSLDQFDLDKCYADSVNPLGDIEKTVTNSDIIGSSFKDPVVKEMRLVDQSLKSFVKSIKELKQKTLNSICNSESSYFQNSQELFQGMRHDTVDHISKRKIAMSATSAAIFEQRLKIYSDWQSAGLIFRPIHLDSLPQLVSLDPVYFVDTDPGLITPLMKNFHEDYSRRIRTYVVNEYSDQAFFSQLPKEQFSIVAAQTFLNFKPLEVINKIITEVFDLLKPGGAFVFTYNNCDFYGAVDLAERSFACYTPGRLIKEHASKIGYNISFDYTEPNVTSFLELTKPGSRTSIRGGQTLALIKNNTIELEPTHFVKADSDKKQKAPKAIDSVDTNYYNDEYIQKIQLSALIIGNDTKRNMVNYSIDKLEQLITERLNKRDFDHKKFQKRLDKLINKRKTP